MFLNLENEDDFSTLSSLPVQLTVCKLISFELVCYCQSSLDEATQIGRYCIKYSGFKNSFLSPGTTFALVASLEVLDTLLASIIFNNIYSATVEWLPGFCYFLMAGLNVIAIFLLA